MWPYEPGSCVVWSWLLLVGALMANWSQARGQTKNCSKELMEDCGRRSVTLPGGSLGSTSGARAGVGILTSPRLSAAMLEFTPVDKRVASLRVRVIGGKTLTVVCAYAPNHSSEYSAFLETLNGVMYGALVGDFIVHTGRFQRARWQRWRYLKGRDWEERPP